MEENIEEPSIQEVKTGKEIIIDYLTGSHEFLCNDNEVELQAVEDTVEFFRQLLNVPKERVVPMEFGKAQRVFDDLLYAYMGEIRYPEKKKIPEGIEGFKIFVSSLLYRLLDIKEDNEYDSSNKNKAKTDPLWLEFVGDVEKAKIGTPLPKEPSWNKFYKYIHQTKGIYDICNFFKSGANLQQFFKLCAQELSHHIELIADNKIKINKINTYLSDSNNESVSKELLLEQKEKIDEFLFNEEVPW